MKRRIYTILNTAFALIIIIFMLLFGDTIWFWQHETDYKRISCLFVAAVVVQGLKAFKIYFVMFGKNISFKENIFLYSKTAIVDILCPFGIGEVFRIMNYGQYIGSYLKGLIAVLIDSFFAMAGFVTVMIWMRDVYSIRITYMVYGVLVILAAIVGFYFVFFQMYRYWKRYFIQYKASKKGNRILEILEWFNGVYSEISLIIQGRGVVLYIVSVLVYVVEFAGMLSAFDISGTKQINILVNCYLAGDIYMNSSNIVMRQYVLVNCWMLIAIWGAGCLLSAGLRGNKHE